LSTRLQIGFMVCYWSIGISVKLTAIGAWRWEGIPVLVGDIALAGIDEESAAVLPTVKSVESVFPKGSGYVVSSTIQKLVVLSDDLAIAWAGPRVAAAEAMGLLRCLRGEQLLADEVGMALAELENAKINRDLSLIRSMVCLARMLV